MSVDPTATQTEPTSESVRVRREREAADRAYNEALTALDRALQHAATLPSAPRAFDDTLMPALNERWQVAQPGAPVRRGPLGRLWARIWRVVAPAFQRQQDFNATLVDHLNRNAESHRELASTLSAMLATCRDEFGRLAAFESRLVQYAQTITAYVDTKDRAVEALPHTLEAAMHASANVMQMRWESMQAREQRVLAELAELRTTLGVAHHAILALKRANEQAAEERPSPAAAEGSPGPAAVRSLASYKYVGFEDQFRGDQTDIRERLLGYVADFTGCRDVLDIGCGRGEFLDLLRQQGVAARGVDLNDQMVGICVERGLDATTSDALTYLRAQPDESLGGLFGAQIVEHLDPAYLVDMLEAAYHKLRPGSVVVLETINPACWFAFFSSYIRDITHRQPIHPETLRYLLIASGFQHVDVRYSAPFPAADKLQPVAAGADTGSPDLTAAFNDAVTKLNGLLFTHLDYAVIARRP